MTNVTLSLCGVECFCVDVKPRRCKVALLFAPSLPSGDVLSSTVHQVLVDDGAVDEFVLFGSDE